MVSKLLALNLVALLLTGAFSFSLALEKLKFGTPGRMVTTAYLPMLAAEEKGLWEKHGLAVEWVPFRGTTALTQALAGGAVKIGADAAIAIIPAMARGLSAIFVAEIGANQAGFFVLAESPVRDPRGFKGLKIGVSSIGGVSYQRARYALVALALDKEVRFVGVGGIPEGMAALKARSVDVTFTDVAAYVSLILKGEVRVVAELGQLVTEEWPETSVMAMKDLVRERPESVGRVVKALAETTNFLRTNPTWAIQRIRTHAGFPQEAAEFAYRVIQFKGDITINPRAMENLRRALIQFGMVTEKDTPPVAELYTNQFTN